MATGSLPWEIHPVLTADRLRTVAGIIRDVRKEVVALHDPEGGDSAWSLGCRAYSRTCHRIARAADTRELSGWLGVVDQTGLHFVFSIGGVPLRFYKTGDESDVSPRTLRRFFPEMRAQQLAFFEVTEVPQSDLFLRLAVETDGRGLVTDVTFLQVDGAGTVYSSWPIPLDGAAVLPFTTRREGVALAPPKIGPARTSEDNESTRTEGPDQKAR